MDPCLSAIFKASLPKSVAKRYKPLRSAVAGKVQKKPRAVPVDMPWLAGRIILPEYLILEYKQTPTVAPVGCTVYGHEARGEDKGRERSHRESNHVH